MPICKVQAPDAVAQDFDRPKAGPGLVCHDLDVMLPVQFVMEEKPKILYNGGGHDGHVRGYRVVRDEDAQRRGGAVMRLSKEY